MNVTQLRPATAALSQARLISTRSRSERANPVLVARLTGCLDGRGWVRRRELCAELGMSDDLLRSLARYSRGEIVGSSAKGYCLTRQASVEDVGAVVGEWLSRSKQLRARVSEVLQVMHGRPHVQTANTTGVEAGIDAIGGAA